MTRSTTMLSSKIKQVIAIDGTVSHYHWCSGCCTLHRVVLVDPSGTGPIWGYNGKPETPSYTPSVKVTFSDPDGEFPSDICHYFLRDGAVEYLSDCTHHLKGTTMPLQDIPPEWQS